MSVIIKDRTTLCVIFKGFISLENIKKYENTGDFIVKPVQE